MCRASQEKLTTTLSGQYTSSSVVRKTEGTLVPVAFVCRSGNGRPPLFGVGESRTGALCYYFTQACSIEASVSSQSESESAFDRKIWHLSRSLGIQAAGQT